MKKAHSNENISIAGIELKINEIQKNISQLKRLVERLDRSQDKWTIRYSRRVAILACIVSAVGVAWSDVLQLINGHGVLNARKLTKRIWLYTILTPTLPFVISTIALILKYPLVSLIPLVICVFMRNDLFGSYALTLFSICLHLLFSLTFMDKKKLSQR